MPTPQVGHFRDQAGRGRFLDAYRRCLAALPPVAETIDVPTSFGTVRVYRFDGAGGRPVLLLPGRNACTPMWAENLPGLLRHRSVYTVDLLGEPGLSVQQRPIAGSEDQAQWFGEMLAGLGLDAPHLMGVSFGGWTATNVAIRRPGKVASLTLLDPAVTFAPIAVRMVLASIPLAVPVTPDRYRRWVLRWIAGGAAVDESDPVAALIDSGTSDFVLSQPLPERFTDDQLRRLDLPVLVVLAGRSVIHDARRAAVAARKLLPQGRVELWQDASHAISGEYPEEIAAVAGAFWSEFSSD